jgi:DNA-binding CsgD family transcriptional regulator
VSSPSARDPDLAPPHRHGRLTPRERRLHLRVVAGAAGRDQPLDPGDFARRLDRSRPGEPGDDDLVQRQRVLLEVEVDRDRVTASRVDLALRPLVCASAGLRRHTERTAASRPAGPAPSDAASPREARTSTISPEVDR